MNLLESGQQLTSTEVAGIVGFVSIYLAIHLGALQAAQWIGEKTLGEDFNEEEFERKVMEELLKQNDRDFL